MRSCTMHTRLVPTTKKGRAINPSSVTSTRGVQAQHAELSNWVDQHGIGAVGEHPWQLGQVTQRELVGDGGVVCGREAHPTIVEQIEVRLFGEVTAGQDQAVVGSQRLGASSTTVRRIGVNSTPAHGAAALIISAM